MDNHAFCRIHLKVVRQSLTAEQRRRLQGAWSYMYGDGTGEFHVPSDEFYWYGSADCAYHARAQGIESWLREHYPEQEVPASEEAA